MCTESSRWRIVGTYRVSTNNKCWEDSLKQNNRKDWDVRSLFELLISKKLVLVFREFKTYKRKKAQNRWEDSKRDTLAIYRYSQIQQGKNNQIGLKKYKQAQEWLYQIWIVVTFILKQLYQLLVSWHHIAELISSNVHYSSKCDKQKLISYTDLQQTMPGEKQMYFSFEKIKGRCSFD